MKKYLFITLLSCALYVNAQDVFLLNYTSLEKQIFIGSETKSANGFLYKYNSNTNEIAITFFNTQNKTDSICFYIYNTKTDSISKEFYYIKNICKSIIQNNKFLDIAISKNYIFILIQYQMYLLDRETGKLIVKQENKLDIDKADFLDDYLFLYCNYNYHEISRKIKTQFYLLSVPDFKLLNETKPKFDYIQYSHITPNHWIDARNGKILFSNTVNYKINLYGSNFDIIDTILLPEKYDWYPPTKDELEKIQKQIQAINIIYEIGKNENNRERIQSIYWISDSTFIIQAFRRKGKEINELTFRIFYDVWKKKADKWYLDKFHLEDKKFSELKLENNEYSLFGSFCGLNYIFTDNNIYILQFNAPISLKNITTEEFMEQSNEYFYDNEPVFQIIKLKHTLND